MFKTPGTWTNSSARRKQWKKNMEDNIKTDLKGIRIDGANWILLAQDRLKWRAFVSTVRNLRVP